MPILASQAALSSMVRHLVLLLLALGVLAGELLPRTEARATPYGVKLCGREFIRAVIFTCGGSRWRRAHDAVGKAGEVVCVAGGLMLMRWVPETRDGGEMRDWGRKFLPSPHAAGEMGQALEAVPRLRELVGRAAELRWGGGGWGERQTI